MYNRFYGLNELPFDLTSNPRFLFLSAQHREALSNLEYGLSTAKPVTVILGEAGVGKTTMLRVALESERCRHVRCVYVHNPVLTRSEFVETLAREFNFTGRAVESKAALLAELEATLNERRARGQVTALVIDEAQSLSGELLEEVRLLVNIETPTEKLLPLVLAGQPEFANRLNEPAMAPLKQRVALRCAIGTFKIQETAAYIASRIKSAGGVASRLFTRDAVQVIHESSRGIPRTINVICDNALLAGFALGRQPVDREVILEVCRDFDLRHVEVDATGAQRLRRVDGMKRTFAGPAVPRSAAPAPAPTTAREQAREQEHEKDAEPGPQRFTVLGLTRR